MSLKFSINLLPSRLVDQMERAKKIYFDNVDNSIKIQN